MAGGSILHEDLSPSCAERRLESLPENIDVEFSVHPGVLEKNNQLAQHAIAKNSPGHQLLGLLDSDSLIPRYPPIDLKRESVSAWLDDDNFVFCHLYFYYYFLYLCIVTGSCNLVQSGENTGVGQDP